MKEHFFNLFSPDKSSKEVNQLIKNDIQNVISNGFINDSTTNLITDVVNQTIMETVFTDTQECNITDVNLNEVKFVNANLEYCDFFIDQQIFNEIDFTCKKLTEIDSKKINDIKNKMSQSVNNYFESMSNTQTLQMLDMIQNNDKVKSSLPDVGAIINNLIDNLSIKGKISNEKINQETITNIKNSISNSFSNYLTTNISNKFENKFTDKTEINNLQNCLSKLENINLASFENVNIKCSPDKSKTLTIKQAIRSKFIGECLSTNRAVNETFSEMGLYQDQEYDTTLTSGAETGIETDITQQQTQIEQSDISKILSNNLPIILIGGGIIIVIILIIILISVYLLLR